MKRTLLLTGTVLLMMAAVLAGCSSDSVEPEVEEQPEAPQVETPGEQEGQEAQSDSIPEDGDHDTQVVDMLPTTRAIELTASQQEFVKKNNDFSFNFYRAVNAAQGTKSIICSPLSVSYVLGMLNAGAQGKTSTEITGVLGYGANGTQEINAFCKSLMEQAGQVDPSVTVRMANCLVANRWVELEDAYIKDMSNYYHAEVSTKDFAVPSTLNYINGWCNEQTEGMIPSIIDELDPTAAMVLMNAVYFKATWSEKFDETDTRNEAFVSENGSQKQMPMMHRNALILYSENDLYRTIYLPYGGNADNLSKGYQMAVLLPQEGKTVNDIVSSLTQESWYKNRREQRQTVIADIKIPRFSTKSDMELNDVMRGMGAPTMFTGEADFSLMTKNAKESLFVKLLKQKAAIDVSEEGTKLTAVTVGLMAGASDYQFPSVDFHCNRPFVYIVQETSSEAVFFIGTYHG